ncbi:dihydropteroate synthase [Desulfuromonas thiophila]|uniref:dihydropteroate synthase n=1 Tax=Desulfuromonas thiophila TaxID=57664 RepID=UPI0029F49F88|nr:dihydropteroate synthase [Desulfuromonas thiophila]
MNDSPRLLQLDSNAHVRAVLEALGADPAGVTHMVDKVGRLNVLLPQVPCGAANILKQEMLALGAEAAVARGTVSGRQAQTDVLLMATAKQLRLLCQRLAPQPFGLPRRATQLKELLDRLQQPSERWRGRCSCLSLRRPCVMGILNVTPDSFFDGGRHQSLAAALRRAEDMVHEGADLIDVGGESTRPGSQSVSAEEEVDRLVPVIEAIRQRLDVPLSVDTSKAAVARQALAAGACFVNDISGLTFDAAMAETVAQAGAGLVLMHTPSRPDIMQQQTVYTDLVGEVMIFLERSLQRARAAGVAEDQLVVDPGIGFGKTVTGNLTLLRRLPEFQGLGVPVLIGTSRKSFIGTVLSQALPDERLAGSLATVAAAVLGGARIVRVHDVAPTRQLVDMIEAVRTAPM